jgi:hypothetical protein
MGHHLRIVRDGQLMPQGVPHDELPAGPMLPDRYRALLVSDLPPAEVYRRCVELVESEGSSGDYGLTEAVVYGCEVRLALEVLRHGPPESWHNFGDPSGHAEDDLWRLLDPLQPRRLAFVGSGPYPVTACLVAARYPGADLVCVDNNIVAHLLGQAVLEVASVPARFELADAAELDYAGYDAVIVAAMVSAKQALVARILEQSNALVVVRSKVEVEHPRVVGFPSPFGDDGAFSGGSA